MKKQKTIKILLWVTTFFFIMLTLKLCFECIQAPNTTVDFIGWSVVAAVLLCLNIIESVREDKKAPLNMKKQKAAVFYCAAKKHGTKKEFIDKHGEEIYNHFLQTGIIHELLPTDGEDFTSGRWEYTVRGEKVKEDIFS